MGSTPDPMFGVGSRGQIVKSRESVSSAKVFRPGGTRGDPAPGNYYKTLNSERAMPWNRYSVAFINDDPRDCMLNLAALSQSSLESKSGGASRPLSPL
jgi:hypothetical protein